MAPVPREGQPAAPKPAAPGLWSEARSRYVAHFPWQKVISPMKNPFNTGYYNEHDLEDAGFKSLGQNVQISTTCTIVGLENIEIGSNVRIDAYCSIVAVAQGWLRLGSFIHIGGYCLLSAGDGIRLEDFTSLSQGVRVYSRSDDYSGIHLTNPTVPERFTDISRGTVSLGRHVMIGSGSVILPAVTLGEGAAVGALSLVNKDLDPWGIYAGTPAKKIKDRSKRLLELERELLREIADNKEA